MGTGSFEGKVALVTGAGRGIGRAVSIGLATAGARVALLARSQDELDEVATAITQLGGVALAVKADISEHEAVMQAVDRVASALGPVDVLINNAAVVWPLGATAAIDQVSWAAAIGINVTAVLRLTAAVLPNMIDQSWGRIVNVSSGVAARPTGMIGANAYVTSKAALEAHTVNLAAELADTGVTVNGYRPGAVDTAMQGWIRSQPADEIGVALHERFMRSYEQGSLITPDASAAALLKRLSSDATGEIWNVSDA